MMRPKRINFIVSGLERSGTSLMMQILEEGGVPTIYDNSRPADNNNPKGYYELFGGKIISKLEEKSVNLSKLRGGFIKITAFGLTLLPPKNTYCIIYMVREYEEVLISTEKMTGQAPKVDKEDLEALESDVDGILSDLPDAVIHYVRYEDLILRPEWSLEVLKNFLQPYFDIDVEEAKKAIDISLYRSKEKAKA